MTCSLTQIFFSYATCSLQDTVEKLFAEIDKDKSGKISVDELKVALQTESHEVIGEEAVKAFIAQLDINKDGELSLEELKALF